MFRQGDGKTPAPAGVFIGRAQAVRSPTGRQLTMYAAAMPPVTKKATTAPAPT